MIVVTNTSPLNYLVLIGAIDLLPHLFGTIFIPPAVRDELTAPVAPESVRTWLAQRPHWLHIEHTESGSDAVLGALHWGEREAILLAKKLDADLLILDERAARTVARQHDLSVIGTLGVLNEAGARGLIDIPETVERLRQTTFRAAPSLYKWLLDRHRHRIRKEL